MEIKSGKIGKDAVVLTIKGRFNIEQVESFETALEKCAGSKWVILDLSAMNYIDSSGIGSLIKAVNIAKNEKREIILHSIDPAIMNVFRLAYLDKFFSIRTREELAKLFPGAHF
ncbi:MAG TPA: STAS domain-containing protein [Spirochaetota bacterium]|nr:STAS domain-containing protein [Spirochaetota bacterium]OPZ38296.1 MAG: putative anti-sigma factor antagonist [Spirochaetes bacterium ADurb.BinA120]HNU91217.1 STAS domain-containing protein [Spirochaetota bacterium]HPI15592.1 STAS domain-containing protein [Spirochaetota bacterium]HPO45461.1 STAS domain-containing protein [Spirochaetota bacterium]